MSSLLLTGFILILAILAFLTVEFSLLVPPPKGLPILMYHKIAEQEEDGVTIRMDMLEKQFAWLRDKGYKTLFFSEILEKTKNREPLPDKPVMLTFDDAYVSFAETGLPLLKKYGLKATVFVPLGHLGKTDSWDHGKDPVMSPEALRLLAKEAPVEIGIHSYAHSSYGDMTVDQMRNDLSMCYKSLDDLGLPYVKVLAYPFGAYPKKDEARKSAMKEMFRETGLCLALRIGNRINPWPLQEPYEVKRTDIRGTDSFLTFKIKLKKGRKKLFS